MVYPDHLYRPVWRLYHRHYATLRELEEWYSVDDVINANDVLDIEDEAADRAAPQFPVHS